MPFPSVKCFAEKMSFICFNLFLSFLIGSIDIAKGEKSDAKDLFKKVLVFHSEAFVRLRLTVAWTIKSFNYQLITVSSVKRELVHVTSFIT